MQSTGAIRIKNNARMGLFLSLSVLLLTPAFAADDLGRIVPAAMQQALQRDLGLTAGDIRRYLEAERQVTLAQSEAQRKFGESYAGSWLERDASGAFSLVVATTQQAQAIQAKATGARVRVVEHSLATLDDAMSLLNRAATSARIGAMQTTDPNIYAWRIDLPSNRIVVTVPPGAQGASANFVASRGVDPRLVRFEASEGIPLPAFAIRGGDKYDVPGSWCSIGFSATQGGSTGFVTAGHCGVPNTAVTGHNGVPIGHFAGSTFPGNDFAWVLNTNPSWSIQPLVNNYSNGVVGIVGNLETPVGGVVCRSGARSGYRCGMVTAKNVTVNYAAGPVFGMVSSSACVGGGDSGGSFITPAGEAQGVTSGGLLDPQSNENCSFPGPLTFHQPLQPIINAYGLVLQTEPTCGRMNPGRVLPNNSSVSSCDGRFTLSIQGDGHLVLYQAGVGAIWWNNVFGNGHVLAMQTDGHLVVYNGAGQAVWYTGTHGNNGALLVVQNDGNVVIYNHMGQALWHTGTYGR